MKICKVCLQSDILCAACNKKLEGGKIKNIEVGLSRAIHVIGKERSFDADFLFAEESSGRVFIVVESKYAARFIGPGGRNIKKLSQSIGKPIKLLEKASGSEKHVIEKLIGAPILGINKIYSTGESYKVRIERRFMKNVQPLSSVVSKILGKKVSFVFE